MLGLLRKTNSDAAVVDAIQRCAAERAGEPVAWLQAALKAKPTARRKVDALEQANAEVVRRFAQGTP
jgi:hypothetical protein